ISTTPTPPGGPGATQAAPAPSPSSAAQIPDGPPVSLSIEQLPLPVFIDGVLGEALKLSYSVDPQVKARSDLVTLRLARPRPPAELLGIAENVLRGYGVRLSFDADRVRVLPSEALFAEMPRVIRGRSLPDVPMSMRPLFQVVDLGSLSANDAAGKLQRDAHAVRRAQRERGDGDGPAGRRARRGRRFAGVRSAASGRATLRPHRSDLLDRAAHGGQAGRDHARGRL
ncbi:MAG: hypothetical protein ACOVVK_15725, partial [Elsteraceae bacterium]